MHDRRAKTAYILSAAARERSHFDRWKEANGTFANGNYNILYVFIHAT